jgi:hypothetical protein
MMPLSHISVYINLWIVDFDLFTYISHNVLNFFTVRMQSKMGRLLRL